eukprot:TRINITY_DN25045_c0_g1_i2.p1 TRINITY_DN25045_c0_g1~~TRINITY_DN25045_c0_g1_i2.p1  ORF type:complete len:499 (-),score=54.23 TRINITY_DN25045_c0_g1_i2:796-2292(-)
MLFNLLLQKLNRNQHPKICLHFLCKSSSSSSAIWISPLSFLPGSRPRPQTRRKALQTPKSETKYLTHAEIINLINSEPDLQKALDIFNSASKQRGFSHNYDTFKTLIMKLARAGKFKAVEGLLNQMQIVGCRCREGLFLFLIKCFCKAKMPEKSKRILYRMRTFNVKPSPLFLSTLLNALLDGDRLDLAKDVFSDLGSFCLVPDACMYNAFMKFYCRIGDLQNGFLVLGEMRRAECEAMLKQGINPDAFCYDVLINAFCERNELDEAKRVFEIMKRDDCEPNLVNFSSLMKGLCRRGKGLEASEILEEMLGSGFKPDAVSFTPLIDYLCKQGTVQEALEMIEKMRHLGCKLDVVCYNIIIGHFSREGRYDDAFRILDQMLFSGCRPNKGSYRIVMNSLVREGELRRALKLFELMTAKGVVPHYETSNSLVAGLVRAGRIRDVLKTVEKLLGMGFVPSESTWNCMVSSVCKDRKLAKVTQRFQTILDAHSTGVLSDSNL